MPLGGPLGWDWSEVREGAIAAFNDCFRSACRPRLSRRRPRLSGREESLQSFTRVALAESHWVAQLACWLVVLLALAYTQGRKLYTGPSLACPLESCQDYTIQTAPQPSVRSLNPRRYNPSSRNHTATIDHAQSSTLNALLGSHRVAVSSHPGRTKHYQTHSMTDALMLCDCPGLVFPRAGVSLAMQVCAPRQLLGSF
jgi:hypothetical protein